MTHILRARFLALAAVALVWPVPASATTIDPLLFEELVLGADFVGVVECRTAGGIVAEYLVVSTTAGGGVPLWWRGLPADYRLPLFQGRQLLAPGADRGAEFAKTRKAAQALLALHPAKQEAAVLRAVIEKDLFGRRWMGGEPDEAKAKDLQARLAALADPDALAGELLRLAKADPDKWSVRVRIVLGKAGGPATLARLGALPTDQSPWGKDGVDSLVAEIKERRSTAAAPSPTKKAGPDRSAAPAAGELARMRKALTAGPKTDEFLGGVRRINPA